MTEPPPYDPLWDDVLPGMYFDRAGNAISMRQWATLVEQSYAADDGHRVRRVAADELPGGVYVSTVWIGLDQSFGMGPPLIFETMAFVDGEPGAVRRYATEEQAHAGHADLVERIRTHGVAVLDVAPAMPRVGPDTSMIVYGEPPEGWYRFGTYIDTPGPVEFSTETDIDGLPLWERPSHNEKKAAP